MVMLSGPNNTWPLNLPMCKKINQCNEKQKSCYPEYSKYHAAHPFTFFFRGKSLAVDAVIFIDYMPIVFCK